VSVDRSIRPPSYVIRFEGRERETEGTRLSLHPKGAGGRDEFASVSGDEWGGAGTH
jgi:hypothetical protein